VTALAVGLDLEELLAKLAATRPLFHSEADFQLALAWQAHLLNPVLEVRLEYRPVGLSGREYLDVLLRSPTGASALELKYPTRALTAEERGERFELRNQGAQDITRYDVIKDVARVERIVSGGGADDGAAVVLTNDAGYWRESFRETIDRELRLHEGRLLSGDVGWTPHAGAGITRGRETRHALSGSYALRWRGFSRVSTHEFRYLAVHVT
jgi:hypothetical protein